MINTKNISTKNVDTKIFFEQAREQIIISNTRKEILRNISNSIIEQYKEREQINLNFICTHNSRRSQFAQAWSFFAIEYFGLKNMYAYSGGTEVTSFHRNTIKSLQKAGFIFNIFNFYHQNPHYLISFANSKNNFLGFSKTYDDSTNNYPYIAITTCDEADQNCPFIPDAISKFHLPYSDPKESDNTDLTTETYLKTNKKIAGEIFFIFDMIKKQQ